jgi:hypothetical protein
MRLVASRLGAEIDEDKITRVLKKMA